MIKSLGQNKYRFVVSVTNNKKRKRFTTTVVCRGGKRELKRLYDEFEKECRKTPVTDVTVKRLLENHIKHCNVMGRKQTTIHGYEVCAERVYSSVGDILAKELTTARLEEIIAEMSDNGLSAKTIRNTVGLLSAAYEHAIAIKQLRENPCNNVSLPKGEPRDVRILYINEIQEFLNAISDVDLNEKVAYELALFMGLRRSEILGLKESDVNIASGLIYVHSTRHRVNGSDIEQTTKTKRSTRVLAIPDILLVDIAMLLKAHGEFPHEKTDYLIQDGFGNVINPQTLASRLSRLEKSKGLPHVTLHGLRHTYASLLHSQGVDMAMISQELGHSNLATTMNIYTHVFQSMTNASRGIANTINAFTNDRGISRAQIN